MPIPAEAYSTIADSRQPATWLHNSFPATWPPETERPSCALCRQCINGAPYPMRVVLDLGEQPLANALLDSPDQGCRKFPLQLAECTCCGHVQLAQTVRPDLMFDNYVYRTGMSGTMRSHFNELAVWISQEIRAHQRVCEVGCNDGTLLRALRNCGVDAFGVDPSSVSEGLTDLRIVRRYFNVRQAEEIRSEFGRVGCVVMTNVLAHCPDPLELIHGAHEILEDGGLLIIEVPYVRDMVENVEFGQIYHEHTHFFSLKDIERLLLGRFWKASVEHLPAIHGGTLRIVARKTPYTHLSLWARDDEGPIICNEWAQLAHDERQPIDWGRFRERIDQTGKELRTALSAAVDPIGLYAPAKATVMLNYWGIRLNRIVDDTPEKQSKFVPGVGTPIVSRESMGTPDKAVLLACNFREEAARHEAALTGKILCPLPDLTTLNG